MSVRDREEQIFSLLCEHGELSIGELAKSLEISPSSVRRILADLRGHRFIRRTRGGVALSEVIDQTPVAMYKFHVDLQEARAIAHRAVQLIERGDVIGLSGGRICTELALHMRMMQGITVVTNGVNIAAELSALLGIQVMVTGGFLDPQSFELISHPSKLGLDGIHIHKYFVGTDGITVEHGVTNRNEAEARVANEFIHHSDQTIVLADSTKFIRSNLAQVVPISEIDAIVTTDRTSGEALARLAEAGVKCIVVAMPNCQPKQTNLEI